MIFLSWGEAMLWPYLGVLIVGYLQILYKKRAKVHWNVPYFSASITAWEMIQSNWLKTLYFTREDLPHLKYVTLVIKESMRLYPPFPMFSRSLDKSYEIDGKLTPKGNVCLYISSRPLCEGNCRKTLMITVQILMLMLVALTKDDDDADNVGQCWSIIIIKSN